MTTERDRDKALTYLQRGRHLLHDDEPYVAYGSYQLTLVEDARVQTLCTDGQVIRYNPEYVLGIKTPDRPSIGWGESMIEHETWHSLLGHCRDWTKQNDADGDPYDATLCNVSQDFVINLMIRSSGRPVHPDWCCEDRFAGKTWREVYKILKDEAKQGRKSKPSNCKVLEQQGPPPPKGGGDDGKKDSPDGDGDGKEGKKGTSAPDPSASSVPGSGGDAGDPTARYNDWDQISVEAAEFAQSQGKLPGHIHKLVEAIKKPRLDWKPIVARFFSRLRKGDYSFARPNKRYLHEGMILPSLWTRTADSILAIDTSGSTWEMVPSFVSEIYGIVHALGVPVDVVEVDYEVQKVFRLKTPRDVKKLEQVGGGGTSFVPFFEWVRKNKRRPELVIFFTDGLGEYPEHAPSYKVVWCIPGAEALRRNYPDYYPKFGTVLNLPRDLKRGR